MPSAKTAPILFGIIISICLVILFSQLFHVSLHWRNLLEQELEQQQQQEKEEEHHHSDADNNKMEEHQQQKKEEEKQQQESPAKISLSKKERRNIIKFPNKLLIREKKQQLQETNKKNIIEMRTKNNNNNNNNNNKKLIWNRTVYLPVSESAINAFKLYEQKQRDHGRSWPEIKFSNKVFSFVASVESSSGDKKKKTSMMKLPPSPIIERSSIRCLTETPECEFFHQIGLYLLLNKCCEEHRKLRLALLRTLEVIREHEQEQEKEEKSENEMMNLFLDSGTLLSSARDGGDTLVPWETDIDLGIIGAWPEKVVQVFRKRLNNNKNSNQQQEQKPHHVFLFEKCKLKVSKNKSRDGTCSDAHYVYYASTPQEAQIDTSRVEIWPFREDGELLVHPTRKKLTVHRNVVLPLRNCKIYGVDTKCPGNTEEYLDHEYGRSWRWPKTIHWGKNNADTWGKKEKR